VAYSLQRRCRGDPSRILFGKGKATQMPECSLVKLSDGRIEPAITE
jgi:hypothetical protein